MSTILKALRRLEQEKSAQSDRPLSEAVANTPAPPPATRSVSPWLVAAGSLAAAFSVTVVVFWLLSSEDPAPPAETVASARMPAAAQAARVPAVQRPAAARPSPSQREQAAKRAQAIREARAKKQAGQPSDDLPPAALASDVAVVTRTPAPAAAEEAEPKAPPPVLQLARQEPPRPGLVAMRPRSSGTPTPPPLTPAESIAKLAAPAPEPSAVQPGKASLPAVAPRAQAIAPVEEAPTARELTAATPPVEPAPKTVAAPQPVREVAVEPPKPAPAVVAAVAPKPAPPAPVVEAPAPKPAKPPRKAAVPPPPPPVPRSAPPDVYVARTVWHPIADRRVAVVEYGSSGETVELREGDVIGPLVVGEIQPSGVFFTHDGVELRRRVGAR